MKLVRRHGGIISKVHIVGLKFSFLKKNEEIKDPSEVFHWLRGAQALEKTALMTSRKTKGKSQVNKS